MPRKRMGYDAACYYDGKLLGRCTKADSDAYTHRRTFLRSFQRRFHWTCFS